MAERARIVGVVAAAATLLLGACSQQPEAPVETPTEPPAVSAAPTLPEVPLSATHRYPDGVTLRMSKVTEAKLGAFPTTEDPEAVEGDPYVIITLTWDNRSQAAVAVTPTIMARYGPARTKAPEVHWADDDRMDFVLEPGDSTDYDGSFLIPEADRAQVVIEIVNTPDPSRNVALTGSLE